MSDTRGRPGADRAGGTSRRASRRLVVAAFVAAVATLVLGPAAAGAELLDISKLSCGGLSVHGTGLPAARDDLEVTVANADNDRTLLAWPARTTETGELRANMRTSLTGVSNIRVTVLDGANEPVITTERKLPSPCLPRALPNTGEWRFGLLQLTLLLAGVVLLTSGLVARRLAGEQYRGRHEPSWRSRRRLARLAGQAKR